MHGITSFGAHNVTHNAMIVSCTQKAPHVVSFEDKYNEALQKQKQKQQAAATGGSGRRSRDSGASPRATDHISSDPDKPVKEGYVFNPSRSVVP